MNRFLTCLLAAAVLAGCAFGSSTRSAPTPPCSSASATRRPPRSAIRSSPKLKHQAHRASSRRGTWPPTSASAALFEAWITAAGGRRGGAARHASARRRASKCPAKPCKLPTTRQYTKAFRAFRKRYPQVKVISPWNEANHRSQPTFKNPKRAAQFYNIVRKYCRGCKIVAADVIDEPNMERWLKDFRKTAVKPRLWGLHNYRDTNKRKGQKLGGTKRLLKAVKGEVWLTETGGIVRFVLPDGRTLFKKSESARQLRAQADVQPGQAVPQPHQAPLHLQLAGAGVHQQEGALRRGPAERGRQAAAGVQDGPALPEVVDLQPSPSECAGSGWRVRGCTSSPTCGPGSTRCSAPRSRAAWTWCSCATSARPTRSCWRAAARVPAPLRRARRAVLAERPAGPGPALPRPTACTWARTTSRSSAVRDAGGRRTCSWGSPPTRPAQLDARAGAPVRPDQRGPRVRDAHEGGPPGRRARVRAPRGRARRRAALVRDRRHRPRNVDEVAGGRAQADRRGAGPARRAPTRRRGRGRCAARLEPRARRWPKRARASGARRAHAARAEPPRAATWRRRSERGYSRSRRRDEEARAPWSRWRRASGPGAVTLAVAVAARARGGEPGGADRELRPGRGPARRASTLLGAADPHRRRRGDVAGALLGGARDAGAAGRDDRARALALLHAVNAGGRARSPVRSSVCAGTLFWLLVKAMARIQMPPRPGAPALAGRPGRGLAAALVGAGALRVRRERGRGA